MKECIPVLGGHNAMTFDIPILLRTSFPPFMTKLKRLNVHFGDSLILAKKILKEKHPALRLSDNTFSKASLGCLHSTLFDQSFPAHDALEDAKALRRILFLSNLTLTSEIIVSKCHVV
jgi:DNA polymerase III epsilon subunit-like protein